MSGQAEVKRNEVRRGLADCRRLLRDAEQAIAEADGPAAYGALERLSRAANGTRQVMQSGGRYVPQAER